MDTRVSPFLYLAPYCRVMPLWSSQEKKFVIATSPRDHFLAWFRDISAYFCMKSHTNSRSEKKKSHFAFFTPQSLFFAHAVHIETFRLFYMMGFRIIFAPLFVSYTIAGSQSLRSVSLERFVVKIICQSLSFFFFFASISPSLHWISEKKQVKMSSDTTKDNCPSQRPPVGMVTIMLKYIVSATTPTFFLFW